MAGINEFLFGHGDRNVQQKLLNPQQENFFSKFMDMLMQQGGGVNSAFNLLQGYLDPNSDLYKNFEAPYMQQFNQQTIPGLAERFAGLGGGMGGGLSSSGFGQALGAAGGNLQTQLAQLKSQMQRQAAGDIFGQYNQMANQGLGTRTFENQFQPGSTGLVGSAVTGLASGIGSSFGPGLGNIFGNFVNGGAQ